jgi:hypothetical protein
MKVVSRFYFEELSWRYFVATELRCMLPQLNRHNFTKNNFERLIVLIIASVLSSFRRRYAEIEKIHEVDAVVAVMRDLETYQQFETEYFGALSRDYVTCQILQ